MKYQTACKNIKAFVSQWWNKELSNFLYFGSIFVQSSAQGSPRSKDNTKNTQTVYVPCSVLDNKTTLLDLTSCLSSASAFPDFYLV